MLYWHIYTDTVCGGGVYKCMCSGVSASSVFQNAVTAVRAHVPVLAWDGMCYMGQIEKKIKIIEMLRKRGYRSASFRLN